MNLFTERTTRYLSMRLDLPARGLLLAAALLLIGAYFLPIWRIEIVSPTDPQRLGLALYADRLETLGAPDVGVEVRGDNSPDSRWLPFVVGGLALLLLRGAAIGTGKSIVDLSALFGYFVTFSIWSFAGRLDFYGRYLAAATPRGVFLFVPPLVGHEKIDGLDASSLPAAGSFAIAAAGLALASAFVLSWMRARAEMETEVRMAA